MNTNLQRAIEIIQSNWIKDFKADLFEDIEIEDLQTKLPVIINEYIPIWIEEDTENENLYLSYKVRLENILNQL